MATPNHVLVRGLEREVLDERDAARLLEAKLIFVSDSDDEAEFVTFYEVDDDYCHDTNGNPIFPTVAQLNHLHRMWQIVDTNDPITDTHSLAEALQFVLSAPEWSASFLEDISEILKRAGFEPNIVGATWASH